RSAPTSTRPGCWLGCPGRRRRERPEQRLPTSHLPRFLLARQPMADRNTQVALERFTWRMLSQYVSPWEFERIKEKIQSWDQWCEEWSRAARKHSDIADQALAKGH